MFVYHLSIAIFLNLNRDSPFIYNLRLNVFKISLNKYNVLFLKHNFKFSPQWENINLWVISFPIYVIYKCLFISNDMEIRYRLFKNSWYSVYAFFSCVKTLFGSSSMSKSDQYCRYFLDAIYHLSSLLFLIAFVTILPLIDNVSFQCGKCIKN